MEEGATIEIQLNPSQINSIEDGLFSSLSLQWIDVGDLPALAPNTPSVAPTDATTQSPTQSLFLKRIEDQTINAGMIK